jgi:ABC-type transport system substrate-binding protein
VLNFDTAATGPDAKARMDWLAKQFAKLDLQLVIRSTDYNRFQDKMQKGTAQIFQWGWNADYPDPENFLFLLYGPNSKVGKNGENAANYQNPEFDRLFEQVKNMENSPERARLIEDMTRIARHDAPWVWGFFPKQFSLHHAWYKNSKPNLMANNGLKYKRIVPELRARLQAEWNRPVLWPLYAMVVVVLMVILPAVIGYRRRQRQTAISGIH